MQRLRTVTSLDVSAVVGHHAMSSALLLLPTFLTGGKWDFQVADLLLKLLLLILNPVLDSTCARSLNTLDVFILLCQYYVVSTLM